MVQSYIKIVESDAFGMEVESYNGIFWKQEGVSCRHMAELLD